MSLTIDDLLLEGSITVLSGIGSITLAVPLLRMAAIVDGSEVALTST